MLMKFEGSKEAQIHTFTLLGSMDVTLSAAVLVGACFMDRSRLGYSLLRGLVIALFPGGIFTLLTDYSFSKRLLTRIGQVMGLATYELKESIARLNSTNTFLNEASDMGLVQVWFYQSFARIRRRTDLRQIHLIEQREL